MTQLFWHVCSRGYNASNYTSASERWQVEEKEEEGGNENTAKGLRVSRDGQELFAKQLWSSEARYHLEVSALGERDKKVKR